MAYKKPCNVNYHIFSDNIDEYYSDLEKILEILEKLLDDGHDNIRIYKQEVWNEEEGIFDDGDCIFSIGQFPM